MTTDRDFLHTALVEALQNIQPGTDSAVGALSRAMAVAYRRASLRVRTELLAGAIGQEEHDRRMAAIVEFVGADNIPDWRAAGLLGEGALS